MSHNEKEPAAESEQFYGRIRFDLKGSADVLRHS